MHELIHPQQLNHNDKYSDRKVEIAGSGGAHGSRQWQAALTKSEHQGTLAIQYEVRDLTMARGYHQPEKKSRNFEWHALNRRGLGADAQ